MESHVHPWVLQGLISRRVAERKEDRDDPKAREC